MLFNLKDGNYPNFEECVKKSSLLYQRSFDKNSGERFMLMQNVLNGTYIITENNKVTIKLNNLAGSTVNVYNSYRIPETDITLINRDYLKKKKISYKGKKIYASNLHKKSIFLLGTNNKVYCASLRNEPINLQFNSSKITFSGITNKKEISFDIAIPDRKSRKSNKAFLKEKMKKCLTEYTLNVYNNLPEITKEIFESGVDKATMTNVMQGRAAIIKQIPERIFSGTDSKYDRVFLLYCMKAIRLQNYSFSNEKIKSFMGLLHNNYFGYYFARELKDEIENNYLKVCKHEHTTSFDIED